MSVQNFGLVSDRVLQVRIASAIDITMAALSSGDFVRAELPIGTDKYNSLCFVIELRGLYPSVNVESMF
jgi:hypothetical protein